MTIGQCDWCNNPGTLRATSSIKGVRSACSAHITDLRQWIGPLSDVLRTEIQEIKGPLCWRIQVLYKLFRIHHRVTVKNAWRVLTTRNKS